ncbi:MAG TPA: extracellular solute-binding protein [Candidatus Binatia bacterium]|jgi:iron(III) transport system substrate-binding protein
MISTKATIFAGLVSICGIVSQLVVGSAHGQTDWKREWEKMLAAARAEGQVTVYASTYERVLGAFKTEYPEIKVTSVGGRSSEVAARVAAERRAGKFLADVIAVGSNTAFNVLYRAKALDPLKPTLILPEVLDPSKWLGGEYPFVDPERQYVFVYLSNPSSVFDYNSKLVNPSEFKSYWDVLNLKWQGKIVSLTPTSTTMGSTLQFLYYHPELGQDYLKKLFGSMEATFSADPRQMLDWLAQGNYAICLGCRNNEIARAKKQGLPVGTLDTSAWKEGGRISLSGSLSLANKAPHPNAAKVFINWYLSRKGQIAVQKEGTSDDAVNSRRIDIPKDDVDPANRLIEGRRYFDVSRPEWQDLTPVFDFVKKVVETKKTKG